ncbi:hypothetical protein [Halomicrobium urmianum]|uniref:hypothetical protein n=1 Tax=Halomicrobium urmianum TaxID=1586233 RepID=UPI001CD9CFCC|nr:hypothetical protein [Halomicrobium urmianum]
MTDRRLRAHARDGLLALFALAALLALLARRSGLGALANPVAVLLGVAGAALIEAAFLRYPELGAAWDRPLVHVGGLVVLLAGAAAAYVVVGLAFVAAACWGLATFLLLLAAVAITGRNPLARLSGP